MYVSICMYVCMYVYIHTHIYMYKYAYTYIHTFLYLYLCTYIYIKFSFDKHVFGEAKHDPKRGETRRRQVRLITR